MPSAAAFWTKAAPKYAKSPISDLATYEHTLARTRAFLPPEAKALEIGCGTGTTALKLAGDVKSLLATDIAEGMIAVAQEKPAPANLRFATGIPGDAALAGDAPFDVVLAFNLLHLVPDLPQTLRSIHTLLRPGGRFISKSACLRDGSVFLPPLIWVMQRLGKAPYVGKFNAPHLEQTIAQAGFQIEVAETHGKSFNRFIVATRL
ncbi:class I SAM-dependent methyltransferase [Sulfitobacter pseudonitzschiae]|uniref:Class I SAM-dependent methyltransferase n=1 Tax=Pseudosulfitobacter pseudonitzschiae TaxID=1402135 RepID=A0A9Q2NJE5_9RHOB|nr:class I SAM-dependent methyltransferase [Pseudosulfitobacter pseudonitzschiae]MBM2290347.1 class I SAM-dependent methyltransferase [Pseudosulfitobacter pseudonitzschiae]MBM2295265.1 class I SAM-dependent methyltransferase [Pseudosulfitobacter pseudonitzschiae]MBM2300177.1 class I SAM-dependent methyltransferase [Pseudosulfitobacter pseudonitzschiae]MBM2309962.1 class I SAM-dependent methyltransferase [Pseudosulfitobacter pseudonitzschiae]MBM2314874.1 class I SAM-dependent methyltransferase 